MKLKIIIPVLVLVGIALFAYSSKSNKGEDFYLGGIQVNEDDYDRWANTLTDAGMNTVEVTVYAMQGNWDSDHLWFDEKNEGVLAEVRAAKAKGLRVVLILRVALDHSFTKNKFLWHGMISPKSDSLVNNWFDKYASFVDKWATIGQAEGIDALVIGSEMNALTSTVPIKKVPDLLSYYHSRKKQSLWEKRVLRFEGQLKSSHLWVRGFDNYEDPEQFIDDRITANRWWAHNEGFGFKGNYIEKINARRVKLRQHWVDIISDTRKKFDGELSYASNFDNYNEVDFWSELDFIGINAYFPLREAGKKYDNNAEMQAEFKASWHEVFNNINAFKTAHQLNEKPIFFTELGYIYRENSTIEPWKGFGFSVVGSVGNEQLIIWKEQNENRIERMLAVKALKEAKEEAEFPLQGILYWKLTTYDYHIPYEPFVLHIAKEPTDSLQVVLASFLD